VIEFLGRLDRQVKIRGFRVEPGEVEAALVGLPGVREAVVVARPGSDARSRHLVAYVVPRPEHKGAVTVDEIKSFLRDKVAEWWLPDEVRLVDEIPKTSVGKFDKKVLRARAAPLTK